MLRNTNFSVKNVLSCNFDENIELENQPENIRNIWKGDFTSIFHSSFLKEILKGNFNKSEFKNIIEGNNEKKQIEILSSGISSLLLFIQFNWVGPDVQLDPTSFECIEDFDFTNNLSVDGEDINVNITHPELLSIALIIFEMLYECEPNLFIFQLWYLRVLLVHQIVLDERCPTLLKKVENLISSAESLNENIDERLKVRFSLETFQLMINYGNINKCEEYLKLSKNLLGVSIELTGELGKRTKYQINSLPQLQIDLKLENIDRPEVRTDNDLPEIIELDDNVRLDSIQWTNQEVDNEPLLPDLEQSLLLSQVKFILRALPVMNLTNEEILPIIDCVLKQKSCWAARVSAISLKCHLEATNKRTVERALSQIESLVKCIDKQEPCITNRLASFWTVSPPPIWKIKSQLANLMLSLGLVKGALDLYKELEMWEEVIDCYTILELRHKAAEIISQEIEKKPTVKLLCLLGDATDDESCFERAWELSGKRSSRPFKHWGLCLFRKKMYRECIPYIQHSLSINSLQPLLWLRLGFAALDSKEWSLAATAYRHFTAIEPNSFEAWNNLARVYIEQGDKKRAHSALLEALKTSYDNWQVWDNFLVVSVDTGHFDDVIRAYHRLLDIREKHLDIEVLTILVNAILKDVPDCEENSSRSLLKKCQELLGRITSIYTYDYRIWELYAKLAMNSSLRVQRLQRAYRAFVQGNKDWVKDVGMCLVALDLCLRLGNECIQANDASMITSVKLLLKSALKAIEQQAWPQYTDSLKELEDVISKITEK